MAFIKRKQKASFEGGGLILFMDVHDAMKAEKVLKNAGYAVKLVAPPPELRKGCDLAVAINLVEQPGIERVLDQRDVAYVGVTPLKGETPEQKFKHIEGILNRMSRKLHKTVVGVVPPVPVIFQAAAPKDNGEIFSFIVPATGMITNVCLLIGEFKDQTPVEFKASVEGRTVGSSASFRTRKNVTVAVVNLEVHPGDLLKLSTNAEPGQISGIWLSLLYQIKTDKTSHMKYIAEELFALLEEENLDGRQDES
jgi:hypothetical protein